MARSRGSPALKPDRPPRPGSPAKGHDARCAAGVHRVREAEDPFPAPAAAGSPRSDPGRLPERARAGRSGLPGQSDSAVRRARSARGCRSSRFRPDSRPSSTSAPISRSCSREGGAADIPEGQERAAGLQGQPRRRRHQPDPPLQRGTGGQGKGADAQGIRHAGHVRHRRGTPTPTRRSRSSPPCTTGHPWSGKARSPT